METQSEVEHTGRMKEEDTRTCLTEPDRFEDGEWLTEHQTCRLGPGRRLDSLLRKNSRQIQIGDCIISLIAWNRAQKVKLACSEVTHVNVQRVYADEYQLQVRVQVQMGLESRKFCLVENIWLPKSRASFDTINVNRCLFRTSWSIFRMFY